MDMDYLQARTIEGQLYGIRAMPAKSGLILGAKIGRLLGPFLAKLADPEVAKSPVSSPVFAEALESLFERLDESDLGAMADRLLGYVEREGTPIAATWNVDYAGKLGTLFQVLKFSIEAQFGGFLSGSAVNAAAESKAVPASRSGK